MARNAFYEEAQRLGGHPLGGQLGGPMAVPPRIKLELTEGKLILHGSPARVILRKDKISIGCTDVSPDALKFLFAQYEAWLKGGEYILQP